MPNFMQGWMDEFEKLLEERSGAALTVTHEVTEPRPAALFLSTITLDGPRHGELQVAVLHAELVQFVQLAGRRPLDPQVAIDEALLAEWQNLLEASAERLAAHLQAAGEGEYTVALRELRAADSAATSTDTTTDTASTDATTGATSTQTPGQTEEKSSYVLRSGDIALRIAINTQMEAAASPGVAAAGAVAEAGQEANPEARLDSTTDAAPATAATGEDEEMAVRSADARVAEAHVADARAAADRAAEEEMDRAATAAESRAAQRRSGSNYEESNPYRTHPERLDLLLDIELEATLRFGAIEMPLRKVLELGPGDVLQLDRHVQEPVELVVGDRIVARGEVVLVGGNFGLHVTEVAEPRRRLETIRCLF